MPATILRIDTKIQLADVIVAQSLQPPLVRGL